MPIMTPENHAEVRTTGLKYINARLDKVVTTRDPYLVGHFHGTLDMLLDCELISEDEWLALTDYLARHGLGNYSPK